MTKVSVLMPVYNTNPLYLKTAVESVLQQTLTDFELLILNDSPDNRELKRPQYRHFGQPQQVIKNRPRTVCRHYGS